ncbi:MAG: isoprenyl transferase [Candidatus Schekmanbacteria bacterium]|nr:isoprenyl transferase [Candidatus Schekmanbacteria bacterium]
MDGNGRWAKQRRLNRIQGHRRATETVRTVVMTCRELNVDVLTLYTFSLENWKRPRAEVKALMMLLKQFLIEEFEEMQENNVRLIASGRLELIPSDVRLILDNVISKTSSNNGMILNLALSYGSRAEIVDAIKKIAARVKNGEIDVSDIDEKEVTDNLYTAGLPDPDLMIRTSGEMRISNFLLWQSAYSEIWITPVLWPDFKKEHLFAAIEDYQKRERRFGLTGEQIQEKKKVFIY